MLESYGQNANSNPFPGLRSFEANEDHLFFGRDGQVDELLKRLGSRRFISVVGTSGSGKSSLVRSGLIPSLYSGYMTQAGSSWRVALFRPGEDPIGNLAAALSDPQVLGMDDPETEIRRALMETTLHRSGRGLVECVSQAGLPKDESVLVVVDQFEELFRFSHDWRIKGSRGAAVAFVRLLIAAAAQDEVPVYVALTMRSEFIGNCTEFPGLAETVNDGQYLVPRMTRNERRQAIVGPVAVGGGEISPRLVQRLLNDVGDDPDQLPILQHALMRTWGFWQAHHTDSEPVDLRHYEAIGTMKEALSQHAEEAYQGLGTGERRAIAEKMFKALTDRGSDSRGVRSPRRLAEICELTQASEAEVKAVIEGFRHPGRSFLMPPANVALHPNSVIDISHESLMRIWMRLIHWSEEEARWAQFYLRLSKAAAQFQEGKVGLWREPELQLALNWRREARPTGAWARRYDVAFERAMLFLDHSAQQRDLEVQHRERQRKRQLAWTRRIAMVLGVATLSMTFLGLYALDRKTEADDLRRQAEEHALQARKQEEEAVALKNAADQQRHRAESERAQADELRAEAELQRERAQEERARAVAQEQEATRQKRQAERAAQSAKRAQQNAVQQHRNAMLEKERAEEERIRAEESQAEAQRLQRLAVARALAAQSQRLNGEDQRELAALLAVQAYHLHSESGGEPRAPNIYTAVYQTWSRLAPHEARVFRHHADAVRCLAIAPHGHTFLSGSDDGVVRIFDLQRPGAEPRRLGQMDEGVRSLAWSEDGKRVAAGGFDGSIRLWSLGSSGTGFDSGPTVLGHQRSVNALVFRGTGSRLQLVSGGSDGAVRQWRGSRLDEPAELRPPGGAPILSLDLSPDGNTLAVGPERGGIELLDLEEPPAPSRTLVPGSDVRSLAWSRDGRFLAAGTAQGSVWLLPRGDGGGVENRHLIGHTSPVSALSFSGGSDLLATASMDGSVRLWDLSRDQGSEPTVLTGHDSWVWAVGLTPRGDWVISGGADRSVRAWRTEIQPLADAICRQVSRDLTLEEWNDYLPEVLRQRTCGRRTGTAP